MSGKNLRAYKPHLAFLVLIKQKDCTRHLKLLTKFAYKTRHPNIILKIFISFTKLEETLAEVSHIWALDDQLHYTHNEGKRLQEYKG